VYINPTSQALIELFDSTIAVCNSTAYVEPQSELHTDITLDRWKRLLSVTDLQPPARILDIGCGSGFALDIFKSSGFDAVGMTCQPEEIERLGDKYLILPWDMHQTANFDGTFDLIFARHVLEHSFAPFLVLRAIRRALKANGWLYVEVPGNETSSRHETNPNHWSVMGRDMWAQLIFRAGFDLTSIVTIDFETKLGKDRYFSYIARACTCENHVLGATVDFGEKK
jgi:SAM-dependent methyltransferase